MEHRRRPSLDETASALRRLTHTPRLALRRPSSTSESSFSSSSSSILSLRSHDHREDHSCVIRETPHDDCTLNRFLVWAAFKRNASPNMTAQDRLQCPLSRCRKRFASHEEMLRHLYVCDKLSSGEYWCYDHERVERFQHAGSAKCKRCPVSKRKKIMGLAKVFFSSLGSRRAGAGLKDYDLESCCDSEASPSTISDDLSEAEPEDDIGVDDAWGASFRHKVELQANEIHEIDSNEVMLPTILEDVEDDIMQTAKTTEHVSPPMPVPDIYQPQTVHLAELESRNSQWAYQQETMLPVDFNPIYPNARAGPERPRLEIQTNNLAQYRREAKRRSTMLAPSSSVRSTASTASTNSTCSTSSQCISPMSNWSHGWAPQQDSTMTTPADECNPNPFTLLGLSTQVDPQSTRAPELTFFPQDQLLDGMANTFLNELPADVPMVAADIPVVDVTPPDTGGMSLCTFQADLQFGAPEPTTTFPVPLDEQALQLCPNDPPAPLQDTQQPSGPQAEATVKPSPSPKTKVRVGATSMIKDLWEALQLHVENTKKRLVVLQDNHLVKHLCSMSAADVTGCGLRTLHSNLGQSSEQSPVDLLCFIHLIYSMSLLVHKEDAQARGDRLFHQVVSYASKFSKEDRQAYFPIVDILWKPNGMSEDDVVGLMRKTSSASRRKGMQKSQDPREPLSDILVSLAQIFLDELEYAAVQELDKPQLRTSDLCRQHTSSGLLIFGAELPSGIPLDYLVDTLVAAYGDVPPFLAKIHELRRQVISGNSITARRLELELIHVGRTCLPPEMFLDHYIGTVRDCIDSLWALLCPDTHSRITYQHCGIRLVDTVIRGSLQPEQPSTNPVPQIADADFSDLFATITNIQDCQLSVRPSNTNVLQVDAGNNTGIGSTPFDNIWTDVSASATPADSGPDVSTAATSPPSQQPTPAISSKAESNSICEECGYRPEGNPKWFQGSMAKHKKLMHGKSEPVVYQCPFPGCTSRYTNRPDNLRQHQIKKQHFVGGEGDIQRRPSKRKKMGS
ncbi:uncharacterized protein F5Z01DRAFT_658707 [Emericellopsis atlantica]|uniref:C2H2-type domain-containing protein n=1 Tax=Emericellopsis atlantica TaxID=2614577 RepID=A0A9P7ZKY6_9HYPO|nr:uncharacterized protein F5Z01DRAFT_658707 [Emericellopsis atlantica]KAG9253398.1 hypothetical protein F5Z01DRAFT_658707 [Emericellopsis atlantica]